VSLAAINVLLVEDNPGDARLLRESLADVDASGFQVRHVSRLDEGLVRLAEGAVDVVLLDLSLPDSRGLDTVRRVHALAPDTPIVVLTGTNDESQAVRAVQEGAQDYLVKGLVDGNLLARSMRYAIERHRILGELEHSRRQEHYVATHDLLTRLPNRTLFHETLERSLAEGRRHGTHVAVLFLDLDRFKLANDTFGHAMGDRLLQLVADRLRACVRETDSVARLGGDEFTIVLNNIRETDAIGRLAQKLVTVLSRPFNVDGFEFFLTASIGISVFPGDGSDVDTLVRAADTAMYRAKAGGKNRYEFYLPQMNERMLERMELEQHLRAALDREEFVLHYQPELDLRTGAIIGMEALLRWNHPRLGLLPPSRFIPLAEETGLIVPIGEWVLRTACAQNKRWLDQGLPEMNVAVNISARQFQNQDPLAAVQRALADTGLEPHLLELELTESVLMQDLGHADQALADLKRLGTQISIDDFGTGYSSLAYLTRFPLEKLKIDRMFIQTITMDRQDRALASAIIALARSLDLKPLAEGVETAEQLNTLRSLDCESIQGFFFSRPLNAAAATRLLTSRQDRTINRRLGIGRHEPPQPGLGGVIVPGHYAPAGVELLELPVPSRLG
jgi:diguanylate cyclase (GGDEF)-like protein